MRKRIPRSDERTESQIPTFSRRNVPVTEGRSNRAIARQLTVTEKTVETHSASIFSKLDLLPEPDDHRRVLAVRAWLGVQGAHGTGELRRP